MPAQATGGMTTSIFAQIRKEQTDFMFNWISIVAGYPFNQYWTIKRIHLYLNNKYMDSTASDTGSIYPANSPAEDRIFFNVVTAPCEVAAKMLNLDTKDIRLWPTNPKSSFSTYLLEKEMKQWLKKNKLGKILNQIADEAPKFGSVVLEKTVDGANLIDLRRLILDPTVETIQKSRFVTTIAYMSESELKESGWDQKAIDIAIERFGNNNTSEPYEDTSVNANVMRSTPYIKVFKRFGEVPAWWVDDSLKPGTVKGDKLVKSLFIVAGADWQSKSAEGKPVGEMGVTLFKSRWRKEWPFKDFHYTKTKGRWLGIGIVEMLFDIQVRVNEMKNQKRQAMSISTLHLFQGPKGMIRNVLTDLQNGDVFFKDVNGQGLEPVANEERNLAAFEQEEASYLQQVDKLTFAYEAVRGDQSEGSQVTLGQTQIAVAQSTGVFGFKKENYGLFLQEYFNDLVLPQLMKDLTPEHIMRFTGSTQELQKLDEAAADLHANDYVKKEMLAGRLVTKEDWDAAKQKATIEYQRLGENRFLKIKDSFYDDAEFEFDFLITGEQANPAQMAGNINMLLQEIPNLNLQDPLTKLLFSKLCEQIGISPSELELASSQTQQQQPQMQPGVPPPQMGQQQPQMGQPLQKPQLQIK